RHQFQVLATEAVRVAVAHVGELHAVAATHVCIDLQHPARETMRWQPLGHGVRVQKSAVDPVRWRAENAVQGDGAGGGGGGVCGHKGSYQGASGVWRRTWALMAAYLHTTNAEVRIRHAG